MFLIARVWVQLYSLPIDFWIPEILEGIGQALGQSAKISEVTKWGKNMLCACLYDYIAILARINRVGLSGRNLIWDNWLWTCTFLMSIATIMATYVEIAHREGRRKAMEELRSMMGSLKSHLSDIICEVDPSQLLTSQRTKTLFWPWKWQKNIYLPLMIT